MMTVNDLIYELQCIADNGDGDKEVYFGCDYGDYCHTEQALPVKYVEEGKLRKSAYSYSGKAFKSSDDDEEEDNQDTVIKLC